MNSIIADIQEKLTDLMSISIDLSDSATKPDLDLSDKAPENIRKIFFTTMKTLEKLDIKKEQTCQASVNTTMREEFSFADYNESNEKLEAQMNQGPPKENVRKISPLFVHFVLGTSLKEFHETYLNYYAAFHGKQTLYMEEEEFYGLLNYFADKSFLGKSAVLKVFSKVAKSVYNSNKAFEEKFQAAGHNKLSQKFMKDIFNLIKVDKFVNTGNKYSKDFIDYLKGFPIYLGFFSEVVKTEVSMLRNKHDLIKSSPTVESKESQVKKDGTRELLGNGYSLWNTALHGHKIDPSRLGDDFIAYVNKNIGRDQLILKSGLQGMLLKYMEKIIPGLSKESVDNMLSGYLETLKGEERVCINKFARRLYDLLEQEAERKLTKYIDSTYEQITSNAPLKSTLRSSRSSFVLSDSKSERKLRDSVKSNMSVDTAESENYSETMGIAFSSGPIKGQKGTNLKGSLSQRFGKEDRGEINIDEIELSESFVVSSCKSSPQCTGRELNKKYSKSYQPIKTSLFNSPSTSAKKRGSSSISLYMVNES